MTRPGIKARVPDHWQTLLIWPITRKELINYRLQNILTYVNQETTVKSIFILFEFLRYNIENF